MVYAYHCTCGLSYDVVKSHTEIERPELCPKCNSEGKREPFPRVLYFNNTKVQEAEYNPGLGCWVKDKEHRKEICKAKGLEEIGNEAPDKIHSHYDKVREETRERRWAEADKGWVGADG